MRRLAGSLLLLLILVSCGSKQGPFRLSGQLNGLNQGEFYVYGMDGKHRLDTIRVSKGMFRYEAPLDEPATLVLVFPNFSELPIFGANNTEVEVKGDAAHLKEVKVTGSPENEQMTKFRLSNSEASPAEVSKAAADFIKANPTSTVSDYLLDRYFLRTANADYQQAIALLDVINKSRPDSLRSDVLTKRLQGFLKLKDNAKLPPFKATDINGKTVSQADLTGKANVINVWASWNYESMGQLRQLKYLKGRYDKDLRIISVCLDGSVRDCRKALERDSINWSIVCDDRMWDTPMLTALGLSYVPDNIVIDGKGKIIGHTLKLGELDKKVFDLVTVR